MTGDTFECGFCGASMGAAENCRCRDEDDSFIPPVVTYVGTERFGSILVEKEEK